MLPWWSDVKGDLWRVNKANEVDESILSTGNSKCKGKKKARAKHDSFGNKGMACVSGAQKSKDNSTKQVAHFSSSSPPHCQVTPSVLACQPQGGTQDPVPVLWPLCHPKGVAFVSQDCTESSWAASISFTYAPANRAAKAKQKWSSSKLLPPHHRCHVSHASLWVRNQNSCVDSCGSTESSFC